MTIYQIIIQVTTHNTSTHISIIAIYLKNKAGCLVICLTHSSVCDSGMDRSNGIDEVSEACGKATPAGVVYLLFFIEETTIQVAICP